MQYTGLCFPHFPFDDCENSCTSSYYYHQVSSEVWIISHCLGLGHDALCGLLLYPPYQKDREILWFSVEAAHRPSPAAITKKTLNGLLPIVVHTLVVIVSWPDQLFKVVGQKSMSQRHKNDFFLTFWNIHFGQHFCPVPSWEGHANTPRPLVRLSVRPSVRSPHFQVSVHLLTNHIEEMAWNLACWCIQIIYPRSTSMPMDIVVISCVRPSVQLPVGLGLDIAVYILACWCIQMTSRKSIDAYGYYCPSVRPPHFQVSVHLLTNHLEGMAKN